MRESLLPSFKEEAEESKNSSGGFVASAPNSVPNTAPITNETLNALAEMLARAQHQNGLLSFNQKRESVPVAELPLFARDWLLDCEARHCSKNTIELRTRIMDKLHWFCAHRHYEHCGALEIKQFFIYLNRGHEDEAGRWGKKEDCGNDRYYKPLSAQTIATYWSHLHTGFAWFVSERILDVSPFANLGAPIARGDQIKPFTEEEVLSLLRAALDSRNAIRDYAICRFLLSTGCRASEVCALKRRDVDLRQGRATVLGKGNKKRLVTFGSNTKRALYAYLDTQASEEDAALFLAAKSHSAGQALTRRGLLQIIGRLGRKAGVDKTRCSPHTFRHTFAVEFLRGGGNVFALQEILGHENIQMTQKYVRFVERDIECQQRRYNPDDRLGNWNKG